MAEVGHHDQAIDPQFIGDEPQTIHSVRQQRAITLVQRALPQLELRPNLSIGS
jgi:hypothetical protein